MKGLWWKILSILILLFSIIGGLMVPLKPGITKISTYKVKDGEKAKIEVETYNAIFDYPPKAMLRADKSHYVQAEGIEIKGRSLHLSFNIPKGYINEQKAIPLTLLISDEYNGTLVYPDGIQLIQKSEVSSTAWLTEQPFNLSKKKGFVFPYRNILIETIRNTFYHVSLWFAMFIFLVVAVFHSIQFLRNKDKKHDQWAYSFTLVAVLYGLLGCATGAVWAKATWGAYWTSDIKLNMAAISMFIYLAYLLLRSSIDDFDRKAKLSAAYSIFAFFVVIPLIFVLPRLTDSLHPGNGGNPGLGGEDLDNTLRLVFYPTIIGFTLLGYWIITLVKRYLVVEEVYFESQS